MTRMTEVMASNGSQANAASSITTRNVSPGISRRLALLVALLALALAAPAAALAAEPTSKYNQTPTTPSTGPSPSKEASKPTPTTTSPSKEPAPATTSTVPAKDTKASTLPFTGFDMRWSVAIGLVLIGAGLTIVAVQHRQRRRS